MYYQMETPVEIFKISIAETQQNLDFIREKLKAKAQKNEEEKEIEISISNLPIQRDVILLETLKVLREKKWEILFRDSEKKEPKDLPEKLDQISAKYWLIRPRTKIN